MKIGKNELILIAGLSASTLLFAGVMIWGVSEIKKDAQDMLENHCVKTEKSQTTLIPQYIYDAKGNISSTYYVPMTNYLYKCDDHERWR